jgi:formate--tetrahydrofolate ligase
MPTDLEIARAATPRPITDIAAELGVPDGALVPYGHDKAKIRLGRRPVPRGRLILVSAITPTPAGEGKTTTSVGLAQGLAHIGVKGCVALREPSLGPVMGMKGGAAGGGHAQVIPMEDINLHFTGDFHAIAAAHNLLAAVLDNHLHFGNALEFEPRTVLWRRVIDMNDRALRDIVIGLGGRTMGVPRETGFDITAASEIMAILCLSEDFDDLQARLANILLGQRRGTGEGIYARDLGVAGAMAVLLKDAIHPNLVQTLEGTAAVVHGGPFANIAHGCNSVLATKTALELADFVVTEAGFGFDLGAEKFLDIKCRMAGLDPRCVVVVATLKALKAHGGAAKGTLAEPNVDAVLRGIPNLERHLDTAEGFGLPAVVALNHFTADTDEEVAAVAAACAARGVPMAICRGWAEGGAGAADLARKVVAAAEAFEGHYTPMYSLDDTVKDKILAVCRGVYGTDQVVYTKRALKDLKRVMRLGLGNVPICMAKTPASLSDDPSLLGRPENFAITVREIQIAAGAGFIIPITGDILRMPGLPRKPAALGMSIDADGEVVGLS